MTRETQVSTMASTSIYSISNIPTRTGLCNSSLYHRIKTLLPLEYFPACQIWNQSICLLHILWDITQNSIFTETTKLMNRTLPMFWRGSKQASLNWFCCVTCAQDRTYVELCKLGFLISLCGDKSSTMQSYILFISFYNFIKKSTLPISLTVLYTFLCVCCLLFQRLFLEQF